MLKLKTKLFLDWAGFILHCCLILLFASLFNKFFEMLLFILSYQLINNAFYYQFHAETIFSDSAIKATRMCKIISICIELFYLIFCKHFNVSIYANLGLIILVGVMSALVQFYLERVIINQDILKDKNRLLALCNEYNISEEATKRLVMRYIDGMKIREIAEIECVEEKTIKESIRRSKHKMNL